MALHPFGASEQVWRDIVGMGWTGLIVPERYGGAGMGLVEMALVVEEMGAAAFPGPFFTTAVVGATAVAIAGNESQRRSLLPRIADGSLNLSLAAQDEAGRWPLQLSQSSRQSPPQQAVSSVPSIVATRESHGWRLAGRAGFVADATSAHSFVAAAAPRAGLLLCVIGRDAPGVTVGARHVSVGGDRQSDVSFAGVAIDDSAVLGNPEDGEANLRRLFLTAGALKSVEMIGGARRVLDMTVEYAKNRQQFGRPIGSFQAVSHMIAEIAILVESARQLAYQAVSRLADGEAAVAEVGLAKLRANEVFVRSCELAHQCHGAIGFTQEHDLQFFTRRALAGRVTFGDDADHRDAALSSIGL
jgi:alkylation response protein AidB-like acyl-CoA dehydrogenase